jgi:hypothetical protein
VPALPVRATSWWYVGQIAVGNAAVVALGDVVALADAEADDELAATGDDAAEEDAADDEAGAAETGSDAAGAACVLDVQAASTRLPPTMAMSARRCPMPTSLHISTHIFIPR